MDFLSKEDSKNLKLAANTSNSLTCRLRSIYQNKGISQKDTDFRHKLNPVEIHGNPQNF